MRDFKYKKEMGYADPNEFIDLIRLVCSLKIDLNKLDPGNRVEVINFSVFLKNGAPIYLVGRDIFEKINQTKISDEIKYKDLKFPLKACTFMLPNEKIITYSVIEGYEKLYNGGTFNFCDEKTGDNKWFFCASKTKHRGDSSTLNSSYLIAGEIGYVGDDSDTSKEENKEIFEDRMFCLKMILLMQDRPEIIHGANVLRKAKGNKTCLRSMRVIGSLAYVKKDYLGGTHASPMIHIRKGHFRKQPVGPQTGSEFKIIWIEPMMIGKVLQE